jgi:hypothetical protein
MLYLFIFIIFITSIIQEDKDKEKEKDKEEELDKMSASIIVGQSEEYDTLLRDLNAREKVNSQSFIITKSVLRLII